MTILTINSAALMAHREVPVGPHDDIVPIFQQELRKAAVEIARKLAKQYHRNDLTVEVY